MTPAAPMLADLFLSLAALAGLWALVRVIEAQGAWAPLNRRFLIGLRLTMLLFAGRALIVMTGAGAFYVVELIAAALIPLAVLILTEGLLRRHAPRWIKLVVAAGAAVFMLWAFVPGLAEPVRWRGLLIYQLSTLAACGWMVMARDQASLSALENRAVGRVGLSLVLLVPLIGADFGAEAWGLPVQLSPLAVLFLCWLAVSLNRTDARHGASLRGFCYVIIAAASATVVLAFGWAMTWQGVILTGAVVAAAMVSIAVITEARLLRAEAEGQSLLRHLAGQGRAGRVDDPAAFLAALQGHPAVEGAVRIKMADLPDLDQDVLRELFAAKPILRRAEAMAAGAAGEGDEYATFLFDRFEASHVMLVSDRPLEMLALSMPSVAASSRAELELAVVQRMALLMAQRA